MLKAWYNLYHDIIFKLRRVTSIESRTKWSIRDGQHRPLSVSLSFWFLSSMYRQRAQHHSKISHFQWQWFTKKLLEISVRYFRLKMDDSYSAMCRFCGLFFWWFLTFVSFIDEKRPRACHLFPIKKMCEARKSTASIESYLQFIR